MFTYPYQILEKRIKAAVPGLREVDWYLNQDSTRDKSASIYTSKNLYFEFVVVSGPRAHGHRIQSAIVDISAHLVTENTRDKGASVIRKTEQNDHMMIFDAVYKALQGFSSKLSYLDAFTDLAGTDQDQTVFNSMSRNGITPPHRVRKTMIKSIQRFRCVVFDHAANKLYTVPDPAPALEVPVTLIVPEVEEEGIFDETFDDTFE